jgi:hypothetical protein
MKNRLFTVCAYISTAFFLTFAGLFIYAWMVNPSLYNESHRYFSIIGGIKMTVIKDLGGYILFFNQGVPYSGGVTSDKISSWRFYGFLLRILTNTTTNEKWWTLWISFWYPLIIFSILPLIFFIQKFRAARNNSSNVLR